MFRKITLISFILSLIVILAGTYNKLSGAELACPDWPGCFGRFVISDDVDFKNQAAAAFAGHSVEIDKARLVMGQRYLTGLLGFFVLMLNVLSWRKGQYRMAALTATSILIMLLGAQAFVSVWLIKLNAMPVIAAANLLLGMTVCWQLYWLYLRSDPVVSRLSGATGPIWLNRFAIIVLALQIVLGIWVSVNQAALVCNGFPTCNGQWWLKADYQNALNFLHGLFSGYSGVIAFDAQVAIMWLHRVGALVCIVVLFLLMLNATSAGNSKPVRRAGLWLSVLLFIQIGLSVLGGKWGMTAWLVQAHLAGSVLLMLPLISIGFYCRYGYAETRQPVIRIEPEEVETGAVSLPPAPQVEELSAVPGVELYVEPPPASLLSRLKLQLKRTRSGLGGILASLPIGEKEINDDLLEEIEAALIMADVGIDTTNNIINRLTHQLERHQLRDGVALTAALKQELLNILRPCNKPLHIPEQDKPFVILVVGVNGAGKTTTIGKLAKRLQAQGNSVMLAAGDTFRAAAVEQLQVWGERNNIHVVAQHTGADSASVIFDGVQSAMAKGVDVLIADTAGRLHTKSNLMDELKKVKRIMSKLDEDAPHEVLLVLDAGTGQNALSQAKLFNETVKLTGLVLTKLDGTAKGGVIFALAKQTGIPIRFIGIGEGIDDLQDFNAENFVDALFVND